MTIFDWTQFLPEILKVEYEKKGIPQTIIEKVLQLLTQVLSGEAGTIGDVEAKLLELKNFWDVYLATDPEKLKYLLDSNQITTKVAAINEICNLSTPEQSEKAYLATVQSIGKLKGTFKGIQSILRLFGISVSIVPWYDPTFVGLNHEECSVIITVTLDNGCLSEGVQDLIEEIVSSLLDVCVIVAGFRLLKEFSTQIPMYETFSISMLDDLMCFYWDWRTSRNCCDVFCIANSSINIWYSAESCPNEFTYSGIYVHKCGDPGDCAMERIDVSVVDPIIRSCAELNVSSIEFQTENTVRYYLENDTKLIHISIGDPIVINNSDEDSTGIAVHDGNFLISAFNNAEDWIEISNIDVSNAGDDDLSSEALLAINLAKDVNREILSFGFPVREPVYDNPIIPGVDIEDSIGEGSGYTANEFVGTIWPKTGDYKECPDIFSGYYGILDDTFQWELLETDSIGNEYYLVLEDSTGDLIILSEPGVVLENDNELIKGTQGNLSLGEWDYDYPLGVSYQTIIIKLSDGASPNDKVNNYLKAGIVKDYCLDTIETHGIEHFYI